MYRLSPGEAHILNTSMNIESMVVKPTYFYSTSTLLTDKTLQHHISIKFISINYKYKDIEHILLVDTRSILVFYLNMSWGIAYFILYE